MHYLNNGSQVSPCPPFKNRLGSPGYFTESNDKGAPSHPGQDYYNAQILEFQTALSNLGIPFNPDKFDHLSQLFIKSSQSVVDWLVGFILPDSTVAPVREFAFLSDGSSYNVADYPKLMGRVKDTPAMVAQSVIDAEPEKYAAKYGLSADGLKFTTPNYTLRPHLAAAGVFGAVGTTKEDHIQNITGSISTGDKGKRIANFISDSSAGAIFSSNDNEPCPITSSESSINNRGSTINLDASRVARTGAYTEVNSSFLNFYIIHGETV